MGPVTLIFDLFDLETDTRVVSKVENLPSNWGTLGLWVLELFAMYTTRRTDRQTDGRTKATLIAPLSAFQLRSVRRSLTTEATRALVQAFISCRLDYCNSVLAGVPDVLSSATPVSAECGSPFGLRGSSSRPHHAGCC